MRELLQQASTFLPELIRIRRQLHAIPEPGLILPATQAALLAELEGLGLEVSVGRDITSITAVLRGVLPGPAVLLRADMDALPIVERSGEPFAPAPDSTHADAMHACGHDLHMAALIGAARLLVARRDRMAGNVILMFQPGEEGWNGAGRMLDEGLLTAADAPVVAAYALHVFSSWFPRGVFVARPGVATAASAGLAVRVIGAGTHGSAPHLGLDPIPVAAEMVTALQTMVTRQFDAFDPVVITVGTFRAGTRRNIVPAEATFEATVRSVSAGTAGRIADAAVRLCGGIAEAHGLTVDAVFTEEDPAIVNDVDEFGFAAGVVGQMFGPDRFQEMATPLSVSEDFSRVLAAVPGAYLFLGAAMSVDYRESPANHSAFARFDEGVLADAAALLAGLAIKRLEGCARSARPDRDAGRDGDDNRSTASTTDPADRMCIVGAEPSSTLGE